jgi:hypothetical protein
MKQASGTVAASRVYTRAVGSLVNYWDSASITFYVVLHIHKTAPSPAWLGTHSQSASAYLSPYDVHTQREGSRGKQG